MAKSKYDKIEPFLPKIKQWLSKGVYEYQIVSRLGISKPTWEKYKKSKPELQKAIVTGRLLRKDDLIPDLENILVRAALGHSEPEAEIREEEIIDDKGKVTIKRTVIRKTYQPDIKAAAMLLANFTRQKSGQEFSTNPVELDIKKKKLELDEKAAKLKEDGWN